ncbi:MAG: thiamine pyrophosphate-binding protein [Haloferacaceae archaeon]
MDWAEAAVDGLQRAGVDLVVHLPDSAVDPVLEATEGVETTLVSREEEAVGVLAGAWVGGRRGALVCQSSGLANTFNALGSLAVPARTPFVGLVSRRGGLGEFNIAQVPTGYGMPEMLDAVGVRNHVVERPEEVGRRTRMAAESAFSTRTPYVVLLDSTVTGYKSEGERA